MSMPHQLKLADEPLWKVQQNMEELIYFQLLLNSGALIIGSSETQYNRAREFALENGHRAACNVLERFSKDIFDTSLPLDDGFFDFSSFEI